MSSYSDVCPRCRGRVRAELDHGSIEGTVKTGGSALPGVTVEAVLCSAGVRTVVTDARGISASPFWAGIASHGVCRVNKLTQNVPVEINKTKTLDVTLNTRPRRRSPSPLPRCCRRDVGSAGRSRNGARQLPAG
jgi:hypothetical protein